jgi:ubiquinone/menaquinone biosynthesis C-methylase UbiE
MNNILKRALMNFTKTMYETSTSTQNIEIRAAYYESLWNQVCSKKSGENYLDIGAGDLTNTITFGKYFKNIYAMDVRYTEKDIARAPSIIPPIRLSSGDAHKLTYQDNMFDVVSMISLLEHLKYPDQALKEAVRVLKPGGELILQILNKYFPLETHVGLPFIYYIPKSLRNWMLPRLGYGYYHDFCPSFPSPAEVYRYLHNSTSLKIKKTVIIPTEIVPAKIRFLYKLAVRTHCVYIIPQSWLMVYEKKL